MRYQYTINFSWGGFVMKVYNCEVCGNPHKIWHLQCSKCGIEFVHIFYSENDRIKYEKLLKEKKKTWKP